MKRSLLLGLLTLAVTFNARDASAFCQATTCDPADPSQHCELDDVTKCVLTGEPLYWASSCLTISVQSDAAASAGVDYAAARGSVERAFAAWTSAKCDGGTPSMAIELSAPVECSTSEYSSDHRNANIVMFREEEWPYVGGEDALGLTRVRFDLEKAPGELWDADIEVNAVTEPLSVGTPGASEVDLDSLLTHEAGHVLGLGHTLDVGATMGAGYSTGSTAQRTPEADDIDGICSIYPPGRKASTSSCEPRHGFSGLCASEQPAELPPIEDPAPDEATSSSCALSTRPSGSSGSAALALLLGAAALLRRRPGSRAKGILAVLGVAASVACTRLTAVDWSLVKDEESAGGTSTASGGGGGGSNQAGAPNHEGGQGGQGGETGEGGEAGESGSGGTGGAGGTSGGTDGTGGSGGTGTAGAAGSAGTGGSGGASGGTGGASGGTGGAPPIIVIGGAGAIAQSIVLYDGGADAPTADYDGRAGLDARCATAKTALALPHANSVAFISVSETDQISGLPNDHQVPTDKQIVSKNGTLLANTWLELTGDSVSGSVLRVPLITAGVVPATAKRWLSGSTGIGNFDLFHTCDGWTRSTYDVTVQARYGRVDSTITWISYLLIACNKGESHVLCLAY